MLSLSSVKPVFPTEGLSLAHAPEHIFSRPALSVPFVVIGLGTSNAQGAIETTAASQEFAPGQFQDSVIHVLLRHSCKVPVQLAAHGLKEATYHGDILQAF